MSVLSALLTVTIMLLNSMRHGQVKILSLRTAVSGNPKQTRCLWAWLNHVFNRVDEDRRKVVGPDRSCAEWLLRCGASVRWKNSERFERDYNRLPPGGFQNQKVEEIDATDSAVMAVGFPHLAGLKHVKKITLHNCGYLHDDALPHLSEVRDSLEELRISSCGNVTDLGLKALTDLRLLTSLILYDLPEVRDKSGCLEMLQSQLPECIVEYRDVKHL